MSIENGIFEMGSGNNSNNNTWNNQQRGRRNNKKNRHQQQRNIGDNGDYSYGKSSYIKDIQPFQSSIDGQANRNNARLEQKIRQLSEFNENFYKCSESYRDLQELIQDELPECVEAVQLYYAKTNSSNVATLNEFIKIVGTNTFAKIFAKVFESRVWLDDGTWDNIWNSVAYAISLSLENNFERMHAETIKRYVRDILPRIWQPEISDITRNVGVTKDLALDLLIAIPSNSQHWNVTTIDAVYDRFLDKMIVHADDNVDILNWEIQNKLFTKCFGKDSTATKVLGKYLASVSLPETGETVKDAVYKEFVKMIYHRLDKLDIKDISYVLNYVAASMKKLADAGHDVDSLIFSFNGCKTYENIMKGLTVVLEDNPDAGKFLAK